MPENIVKLGLFLDSGQNIAFTANKELFKQFTFDPQDSCKTRLKPKYPLTLPCKYAYLQTVLYQQHVNSSQLHTRISKLYMPITF